MPVVKGIEQHLKERGLHTECLFAATRSGGSGGQHVNRVNTKVELRFNVWASALLSPDEKIVVQERLAHRLTAQGELIVVCQQERSQLQNRNASIARFYVLMAQALKPKAPRWPTGPTRASVKRRLDRKRMQSVRKRMRGGVDME